MFVRFTTRTVEAVNDLTSEPYINALKRFIARKGRILNLYSDNGINCIVANNEIKKLFTELLNIYFEHFIKLIVEPVNVLNSEPFINSLKQFKSRR